MSSPPQPLTGSPVGGPGPDQSPELAADWVRRLMAISLVLAWVAVAAAVAVSVGRAAGVELLTIGIPGSVPRPVPLAEAAGVVAGGLSVLLTLHEGPGKRSRRRTEGLLLAAGLVALGAVTLYLLSMVTEVSGGEPDQPEDLPSFNAAFGLAAVGLSILLLEARQVLWKWIGQGLAIAAGVVGAIVFVAYWYGDANLRGFPFGQGRMAVPTSAALVILSGAVLLARPTVGLMTPMAHAGPGGLMLRRLVPVVIVVPPTLVAVLLAGQARLIDRPRIFALLAVGSAVVLMAILAGTAEALDRVDSRRVGATEAAERAEHALQQSAPVSDLLRRALRPPSLPELPGFDLAVVHVPAEGILAGDALLAVPLGEGRMGLVLVDMVGHGAEPAMDAIRLRDLVLHALTLGMSPAEALRSVRWSLGSSEMMATAVVVDVDAVAGTCRYASAGHPPLIHRSAAGVEELPASGPPLHSVVTGDWQDRTVELAHGDLLVMFTDGMAEPQGEEPGVGVATVAQLAKAVEAADLRSAQQFASWCLAEARGRAGGAFYDDACLVVVRRLPSE